MHDYGLGPKWALYDTVDHVWLGDENGPKTYDNLDFARIAEVVVNEQFGYVARIRAKTYEGGANKLRDQRTPHLTAEQALARIERLSKEQTDEIET